MKLGTSPEAQGVDRHRSPYQHPGDDEEKAGKQEDRQGDRQGADVRNHFLKTT